MSMFDDGIGRWRKSSYSPDHSECVEAALRPDRALVRDTKHRDGGFIAVPAGSFAALLDHVRDTAE